MRSMKESSVDNTNPHKIKVGDAVYLAGNKQIGMAVEAVSEAKITATDQDVKLCDIIYFSGGELLRGRFDARLLRKMED